MSSKIFVNLPVKDLPRSIEFFKALGYEFNPQFTDETATCMVINEHIYCMLLTEAKFQTFTHKQIVDARKQIEALVAISLDSSAEVDAIVERALAAGATSHRDPVDYGFMYFRSFDDLDGHTWEFFYMDPLHLQQEQNS